VTENKLKLLYLSRSVIPSSTANSIQVMKMCDSFSSICCVKLLCFDGSANESRFSVKEIYDLGSHFDIDFIPYSTNRIWRRLALIFSSLYSLMRERPDIVYSRDISSAVVATFFRCSVVLELHMLPKSFWSRIGFKAFLKREMQQRLVTISKSLADDVRGHFELGSCEVIIAHDGAVVSERLKAATSGKTRKRFSAGYFGSLNAGKGLEIIIELAPLAPWADFHVFGGTNFEIEKWRSEKKISNNILFHGRIDHSQVQENMRMMDVLLLPNQTSVTPDGGLGDIGAWTSPLKMFEYMAAKTPILGSSVTVLEEVLKNGENAILCDPLNLDSWQESLINLRDNSKLRERLAFQALNDLTRLYSWDTRARKVLSGII
jgi:glycosyltransferase involved in cell wall biosynthesis